jgi:hypothetical protein
VPVVRRLEAKFRKPANGVTTSAATVTDGALDELRAALAGKGRGLISVNVELHDESGAHALSATIEWFITRIVQTTDPLSPPVPIRSPTVAGAPAEKTNFLQTNLKRSK